MNTWFKRSVLHPYLMAVYPLLALLAGNLGQVVAWNAVRPLAVSVLGTVLLAAVLRLFVGERYRAGLLATLVLLLFYTYGHAYGLVEDAAVLGMNLGRHRILLVIWGLLLVLGSLVILKGRYDPVLLNQGANLLLTLLLIFSLVRVVTYEGEAAVASAGEGAPSVEDAQVYSQLEKIELSTGQARPDIYYIILDAYTRDDTLAQHFRFDNQSFLDSLEDLGFYVARCSRSNYSTTQQSLASSLNLSYLDGFGTEVQKTIAPLVLNDLIQRNLARQTLERLGYTTVVLESGFSPTEWRDADLFLSPERSPGEAINLWGGVNPFESLVFRTSAGLFLYEARLLLPARARSFLDATYVEHRDRILFSLSELEKIPAVSGPKFVFAHILAPHEPFVFGPQGEVVGRNTPFTLNNDWDTKNLESYRRGYRDQLMYLNSLVLQTIETILAASPTPPVIVIQGDHGTLARVSSENARLTILNAYYFPGEGRQRLYPAITPANTFRVLFDAYLGANLGLLDDRSFFYDDERDVFRQPRETRQGCEAGQLER